MLAFLPLPWVLEDLRGKWLGAFFQLELLCGWGAAAGLAVGSGWKPAAADPPAASGRP